jgi:phosphate:Na+ symporter
MGIIHIPFIHNWLDNPNNFLGILGSDGQGAKVLLALCHLVFNFVMSVIFIPLLGPICKLLEKIAPGTSKHTSSIVINELDTNIMKQFPSEGLALAKEQVLAMFKYSKVMFDTIDEYLVTRSSEDDEFVHELEASIDRIDRQMNDYLLVADKGSLTYSEMKEFTRILRGTKDIERIGDYGENLMTFYSTANEKKDFFADRTFEVIKHANEVACALINETISIFESEDKEKAIKIIQKRREAHASLEKNVEDLLNNLTTDSKNKAKYSNMVIFDIISCYQRVYAHCSNIAKLFGTDKEYVYTTQEEERFASMRDRY